MHFPRIRHCVYNMRSTPDIALSTSFINGCLVPAHNPTTWESPNIRTEKKDILNQAHTDECNTGRKSTTINVVLSLSGLLYLWEIRHRRKVNHYKNVIEAWQQEGIDKAGRGHWLRSDLIRCNCFMGWGQHSGCTYGCHVGFWEPVHFKSRINQKSLTHLCWSFLKVPECQFPSLELCPLLGPY